MGNPNRGMRPMTAESSSDVATISPPGRVRREGHGLAVPVRKPFGVDRLRAALGLSADVPVGRVCEDAAAIIERGGNG